MFDPTLLTQQWHLYHVPLIVVPESEDGLRRGIGEAYRQYTRRVIFREGRRGHLWQGQSASFVMDEPHLLPCARYVERNPVRAGVCASLADCPWSSAAAHLTGSPRGTFCFVHGVSPLHYGSVNLSLGETCRPLT